MRGFLLSKMKKTVPFTKAKIKTIIKEHPTPFHIYDEKAIRKNAKKLLKTFSWNKGFKEYFAVKVLPNPHILQIMKEEGFGVDCSSLSELVLAEKVGFKGEDIMFTSNVTTIQEYQKAYELGAIINLDDISHIPFLEKHAGIPEIICFRYNPGRLRKHKGNALIGNPEEAKYGLTKEHLFEAYKIMRDKGVKRFGLHTMVVSNELQNSAFVETGEMLLDLVKDLSESLGIQFEFINLGGGFGIPYKPEDKPIDMKFISSKIKKLYQQKVDGRLSVFMECGRYITGPYGYLVANVLHKKNIHKAYVGLDATMANLMRPAMYGAYHHITVLGKANKPYTHTYDVTGSLCENNDKFAINRKLPEILIGDIVVIHDTGAHGHSMGFNYNGKLRSAELLLQENGKVKRIRRAETLDDYFATLEFPEIAEIKKTKKTSQ